MKPLHFFANGWGAVEDQPLDPELADHVLAWVDNPKGGPISSAIKEGKELVIKAKDKPELRLPIPHGLVPSTMGGNTWNTWLNKNRVMNVLGTSNEALSPLHVLKTPGLERAAEGLPGPVVWREIKGARHRLSFVIQPHDSDEPIYLKQPPTPDQTGTIPDEAAVFVSSSGQDIFWHIERYREHNPDGQLILAPGSKQIARGVPASTLESVQWLTCNKDEAIQIAQFLDTSFPNSPSAPDFRVFFENLGIPEVRITLGGNGVYVLTEGQAFHYLGIDRHARSLNRLFEEHDFLRGAPSNESFNGCGDVRIGTELAARDLDFKDRVTELAMAGVMATIHTFRPESNLGRYPQDLLGHVQDLVQERTDLHRTMPIPRIDRSEKTHLSLPEPALAECG